MCDSNNVDAVKNSDIVVVCVKPKHLKDVLVELKPALEPRHLLVSVVTGISINEMTAIIGIAFSPAHAFVFSPIVEDYS
jgi:pyrroline-5-carboxylate reductase